jgi:hypothetical protein
LIALAPFGEVRHELGVGLGWGLALALIVPSYLFMAPVIAKSDFRLLQNRFMLTMLGRFTAAMLGVALFATQIDQPPVFAFVLAFFLGFAILTTLELKALLGQSPDRKHA